MILEADLDTSIIMFLSGYTPGHNHSRQESGRSGSGSMVTREGSAHLLLDFCLIFKKMRLNTAVLFS